MKEEEGNQLPLQGLGKRGNEKQGSQAKVAKTEEKQVATDVHVKQEKQNEGEKTSASATAASTSMDMDVDSAKSSSAHNGVGGQKHDRNAPQSQSGGVGRSSEPLAARRAHLLKERSNAQGSPSVNADVPLIQRQAALLKQEKAKGKAGTSQTASSRTSNNHPAIKRGSSSVKKETKPSQVTSKKGTTSSSASVASSSTAGPSTSEKDARKIKRQAELKNEFQFEDNERIWEQVSATGDKWTTLEHRGLIFPPDYVPHGLPILYQGKEIHLGPEAEEWATYYAVSRELQHYDDPVFQENFFKDWSVFLKKDPEGRQIKRLQDCNFDRIWDWHLAEKARKAAMTKDEKRQLRLEKEALEEPYKWVLVDGRREKNGNFRVEPPGLFRGRGEHPKKGCLKRRIQPEDITINIGESAAIPQPPPGHKWKEVVHKHDVTWIASWTDPILSHPKYVFLAASSAFKMRSDMEKFEKARRLGLIIRDVRRRYLKDLKVKDHLQRQIATALYFIDTLALRVGGEKNTDEEADTVGCTSLRVEHIELIRELNQDGHPQIKFDFLGKDSIRYINTVGVKNRVFKNVRNLVSSKQPADQVFHLLNPSILNKHLQSIMPGLSAKVFRTYNASITLQKQLALHEVSPDMTLAQKVEVYNRANREVAILCNHQRSVPASHEAQMERIGDTLEDAKQHLKDIRRAISQIKSKKSKASSSKDTGKGKSYNDVKKEWQAREEQTLSKWLKKNGFKDVDDLKTKLADARNRQDREMISLINSRPRKRSFPAENRMQEHVQKLQERIHDIESRMRIREENKTVALGTSKINYMDPRITVAWCKKVDLPVKKIFAQTLMDKFPWALEVDPSWDFTKNVPRPPADEADK